MAQIFLNNCYGRLAATINATATQITLVDAVGLPGGLAANDWFLLTLFTDTSRYGSDVEVVRVTGMRDNVLTVVRGHEGEATTHKASDTRIEARLTAASLARLLESAMEYGNSLMREHHAAADPHSQYTTGDDLSEAIDQLKADIVGGAPGALDTLAELAAALSNDADFAASVTKALGEKANSSALARVATSGVLNDLQGMGDATKLALARGLLWSSIADASDTDSGSGYTSLEASDPAGNFAQFRMYNAGWFRFRTNKNNAGYKDIFRIDTEGRLTDGSIPVERLVNGDAGVVAFLKNIPLKASDANIDETYASYYSPTDKTGNYCDFRIYSGAWFRLRNNDGDKFLVNRDGVIARGTLPLSNLSGISIDGNGFVKKASPIFRLTNGNNDSVNGLLYQGDGPVVLDDPDNPDQTVVMPAPFEMAGSGASNDEARGATAERITTGVYLVSGAAGFAKEGWTIELPQDVNGNRLCFVESEVNGGVITVRTFSRRFDVNTASIVAGDPVDIPEGRWIDLRLNMLE